MVVDDAPDNLALIFGLLKGTYQVMVANSGEKALRLLQGERKPDLILLDIMMPVLSGYDVIQRLKADPATRKIPVMFLTAMSEAADEKKGLEMGAADYITKPISPPILMARIRTQLENKAAADFLEDQNAFLESEVERRTREIRSVQDATILALAYLAETRDVDTGSHVRRTQRYVKALAERLRGHSRFMNVLSDSYIDLLFRSAALHDIGKVGIPDDVLLKPGRLTPEEFEIMKTHCVLGFEAIEQTEKELGTKLEFLSMTKDIACYHHEKWNGTGYPYGKAGDDIPVSARLMAVADVYDALISSRPYKKGMSHTEAAEIIVAGKGLHFDPDIIDAFIEEEGEFQRIAVQFSEDAER
jgi:putative two-component system response regulator